MEKTTVYLTSGQKAALARASDELGQSEARLIRDGIDAVTTGRRIGEALVPLAAPPAASATLAERPRWMGREAFVTLLAHSRADAGLRAELRELAPDTTDDEALS